MPPGAGVTVGRFPDVLLDQALDQQIRHPIRREEPLEKPSTEVPLAPVPSFLGVAVATCSVVLASMIL